MTQQDLVSRAASEAARESYGKLLAWLAWKWKDLEAAEDALADAFERALVHWPKQGIPTSPEAWLLTVAKRQLMQAARRKPSRTLNNSQPLEGVLELTAEIPDERLRLLFVCSHPALDESVRTPLMLQMVLGLQAQQIAPALLVSPVALAQRLVRAKQKIRQAGIVLDLPEKKALRERLHCVLEAIYATYGLASDAMAGAENRVSELRSEAIYLAEIVAQFLPDQAEALGLLSLLLFCESRVPARRERPGEFIPLSQQNVSLWRRDHIVQANQILWRASTLGQVGPYQLEAAIQSAHSQRLQGLATPWSAIAQLYDQLNAQHPTVGSRVAEAVAWAESDQLERALHLLAQVRPMALSYQPWWVAQAFVCEKLGSLVEARSSYREAIRLTQHEALKNYLQGKIQALELSS